MLGPNQHTQHLASQAYEERLSHAARIRMIQKDRHDETRPFDRQAHRNITVRRVATGLASVLLATMLAAGAIGTVAASPSHGQGGGATLIR